MASRTWRTTVALAATIGVAAVGAGLVGGTRSASALQPREAPASAAEASPLSLIRGTTAPKDRRKLRFDIRGIVAEAAKKKGETVNAGDLLIRLNDAEQRATLKARQIDADPALAVAEAEQELKVADLTFQQTEKNFKQNAANQIELETDRAKMEIAKIKVDQAKRQGSISAAQAEAQKALVDRMAMKVPEDFTKGVIVDVYAKVGEGVEESRDVVEIIDISQLYIDVRLAEILAVRTLKKDQELRVRFVGETAWRKAKINFIAPEADARAGTLPFRLEMDNPEQRPPGEDVEVEIPSVGVAAN